MAIVIALTGLFLWFSHQESKAAALQTADQLFLEINEKTQVFNARDEKTGDTTDFNTETVGFLEALAAQAAVALHNKRLLDEQRMLFDAFIQLIAGAIDAKSPYTGGHCARVPEVATLLAEAPPQCHGRHICRFQDGHRGPMAKGFWLSSRSIG